MAVSDDVATTALRTVRSPRPRRDNRLVPRVPVEQRTHLRAILVAADAAAIGLAWTLTLVPWPYSGRPELVSFGVAAVLTLIGVWILHLNGLYLARNATMRTMEMARIALRPHPRRRGLGRVTVAQRPAGERPPQRRGHRGHAGHAGVPARQPQHLQAWLTTARRNGSFVRDVLVVGTNAEAAELVNLFADHNELGFRVAGVLGDATRPSPSSAAPLVRGPTDAAGSSPPGRPPAWSWPWAR
jgi:hypothetical protein